MKRIKAVVAVVLLQCSLAYGAVPYNYSGNNPFYEMFLAMMDMMGFIDYNKVNKNYFYPGLSPYGMMPGMTGISPWMGSNPVNSFLPANPSGSLAPVWQAPFSTGKLVEQKSPLEGVWLGSNGDILVFMGEKFFYASGKRHLVGNARIENNKIIADIEQSDEIIKFYYETKGAYLAVRVDGKKILYFKKQI